LIQRQIEQVVVGRLTCMTGDRLPFLETKMWRHDSEGWASTARAILSENSRPSADVIKAAARLRKELAGGRLRPREARAQRQLCCVADRHFRRRRGHAVFYFTDLRPCTRPVGRRAAAQWADTREQPDRSDSIMSSLINDRAEIDDEVYLFLEDYQLAQRC